MKLNVDVTWPSSWSRLLVTLLAFPVAYIIFRVSWRLYVYRSWLRDLKGPANPSWSIGNYADFYTRDVNEVNQGWMRQYGGALRFWAFFGEPRLMLTDPTAINHVLVKHWQSYVKHPDFTRFAECIMGRGLLISEGEQYKRQKFAIQKGFTNLSVKAYYPSFVRHSRHLRHKLTQRLAFYSTNHSDMRQAGVLTDMLKPCARATLDILSDAGFGEPFGALHAVSLPLFGFAARRPLDNSEEDYGDTTGDGITSLHDAANKEQMFEHPLARAYDELIHTATTEAARTFRVFFDVASWFVPELLLFPFKLTDNRNLQHARSIVYEQATKVIVRAREQELSLNERDAREDELDNNQKQKRHGSVIGMLVRAQKGTQRATSSSNRGRSQLADKARLTDEDVTDQVATLMLAGHETSSSELAWFILCLAKNIGVQRKLRGAIVAKRKELGLSPSSRAWGEQENADSMTGTYREDKAEAVDEETKRDLTMEEVESIQYLDWCASESLRLFGPVHSTSRVPLHDDVIPIDMTISPNAPADGIRIRKGTCILIPLESLNQSESLWGDDACDFVPERWAREDLPFLKHFPARTAGAAFSFGPRSCIGSRFTVLEIKTILSVLLTSFVFEDCGHKIVKSRWIVTRPFDVTAQREQSPVLLRSACDSDCEEPSVN